MDTLLVDGDAPHDPRPFFHWQKMRVVEHRPMGMVAPDALVRAKLYLTERQRRDEFVSGHELYQELRGRQHFNANYLDALRRLLLSTEDDESDLLDRLVPKRLERDAQGWFLYVFCWGTLYTNAGGKLYVRYLSRMRRNTFFGFVSLEHRFRLNCPAALLP